MRYLISGGGTGGHIYPALAVCEALNEVDENSEVLYVGTRNGLESRIVPAYGIRLATIQSGGIAGKSPIKALKGAMAATKGFVESTKTVRSFRPDAALGTGGYVSGPVMLACWLAGVPIGIQEQNAMPGMTNRILSRIANRVFLAFPGSKRCFPTGATRKAVVLGNPIRRSIVTTPKGAGYWAFGIEPGWRTVVVFGGSRGAEPLVFGALDVAKESRQRRVVFLVITGNASFERARAIVETSGISYDQGGNVILRPYVEEMHLAYSVAELVVARAGGLTVSELAARGIPSVLVPSPYVAGRHQEHNAAVLAESGGAVVVHEGKQFVVQLKRVLDDLLGDAEKLKQMGERAKRVGKPDAARDIACQLYEMARRSHR
ncbi:MAG TPA: undecaprenyldiphospho-muramoylpentapeptide beta-N-acetylglucosaminyltransferase [Firmicutes bacterium]|nr:undecaprenyldiphospho-muramoylpentapeptide beta-N-acetylglucosaminyltransferase [Bacillota bacterium]